MIRFGFMDKQNTTPGNDEHDVKNGRDIIVQRCVVGMLFVLVALLVIFPMRDYDTFWYLANGRSLFETGHIVDREIFSYTAFGTPFNNTGWLGQYLMYLVFRWGGPDALVGFKVLITLAVAFLLYRTGRILGAPRIWAALLMLFVVYVQLWRFVERTQIFTYLLLALFGFIYHGWRAGRHPGWVIWLVPVILGVWDLFHGSAYGLLLLCAVVAGESTSQLLSRRVAETAWPGLSPLLPRQFRTLLLAAALAMIFLMVNPHGLLHGNIQQILNVINGKTEAQYVGEYLPPGWSQYRPFWLLLLATGAALLAAGRTIPPLWMFIAVPFGVLAMRHCRSIEAFGLVVYPLLAISVSRGADFLDRYRPRLHRLILVVAVVLLSVYLVHFKFVQQQYRYSAEEENIDDFSFRSGINENYFPVGSARFIIANNIGGRMFNSDRFGGYLAYFLSPERPIFHYNHPSIFRHIYGYLHNPAERQKYGITYAIVARSDEVQMYVRDGFVPVYWEPSAMVLVKPSLENRALIQRYHISYFRPLLEAAQLRSIAANPKAFPQLMIEMSDYLAFRKDERIATIFIELLKRPDAPFSPEQRRELLERAQRYNEFHP